MAAGVFDALDTKTQRHLLNAKQIADRQREQVFNEARELATSLGHVVGYLIFLKGAAYSMCGGSVGLGRIYSDIDVLVPKADIKACEQRLVIKGWMGQEIDDYDDQYYREWAHEIPPMAHGQRGTIIDVHHNLVPVISKSSLNIHTLLAHKEEIAPGIYVLTASAQLVHAAIHLFRNEEYACAFRDLSDLYFMLEGQDAHFWEESLALAEAVGFAQELKLAMRYVNKLLGLSIPEGLKPKLAYSLSLQERLNDAIFTQVLLPQHDLLPHSHTPFRHLLATMRGHILKMPLPILIYHLTVKSGRGILKMLFGEHIFTPNDQNPQIHKPQDINK
jgi:hypothetical protein